MLSDLNADTFAVSGVAGNGEIRAASPLSITADASTTGGMTYTASDSATDDVDHLTVSGAGTEVRDDTSLVLNAGDDLNISVGTTVEVVGVASTLTLNLDALGGGAGDTGGETANLNGILATDGASIQVVGGGQGDAIIIDNNAGTDNDGGTVENILNNIVIDTAGGIDTLTLDDSGDPSGDAVNINSAAADVISGQIDNGSTITYNAALENLVINSSNQADIYTVAPDANTSMDLEANNPTTLGSGDRLLMNLAGRGPSRCWTFTQPCWGGHRSPFH